MKKLFVGLLIAASPLMCQDKVKEPTQPDFYVTMGTEIPLKRIHGYPIENRMSNSIGIGVRHDLQNDLMVDVGTTFYHTPLYAIRETAVGLLFKPDTLKGVYVGATGLVRVGKDIWCNKALAVSAKGVLGYQTGEKKNSFVELAFDAHKNLSIRSGLLF